MKKGVYLLVILIIFSSCTYVLTETAKAIDQSNRVLVPPAKKQNIVSVDDTYEIKLPFNMIENSNYNDSSLISYSAYDNSMSIIIYKESIKNYKDYKNSKIYLRDSIPLLENYKKKVKKDIRTRFPKAKFEDYGLLEINEFEARQLKVFTIENDKTPVSTVLTLLRVSDGEVYHIISWTLSKHFNHKIGSMEQIPFTFQKKKNPNEIQ